jgi:hypothetical protein
MFVFRIKALYNKGKIVLSFNRHHQHRTFVIDAEWVVTLEKFKYLAPFDGVVVSELNKNTHFVNTSTVFVSGLLT